MIDEMLKKWHDEQRKRVGNKKRDDFIHEIKSIKDNNNHWIKSIKDNNNNHHH
jgi:hypothetical protein